MKKLMMVLLIAALTVVLAVSASAELYSPEYYGVEKVEVGTITVDGVVDEAYGEPIFYFEADGELYDDQGELLPFIGDYTDGANWFFTNSTAENKDDVLSLIAVDENYVYGYAKWTEDALYLCVDANILGWNYPTDDALTAQRMWEAFCLQLGIFDLKTKDNTDWGLAINEQNETIQRNFGQNKNGSDKMYPLYNTVKSADGNDANDQTDLVAKVTREGSRVIYEAELRFDKVLSFIPVEGDSIGLDILVSFGDYNADPKIANRLTFVNSNYQNRDYKKARPLYFVENSEDAAALYKARADKEEAAKDDDSIALFGCNDVPEGTNFVCETEDKVAGSASLLLVVNSGVANENKWTFDAVNGTDWDTLRFHINVTDPAIFDTSDGVLELGSNGKACMSWTFAEIKELNQGDDIVAGEWCTVVLALKQAADFDISSINYLGLSVGATQLTRALGITVDSFRLSADQAILAEKAYGEAAKINERIEKLAEVTDKNYLTMGAKVRAIREAYEELDELAKSFVDADMLAKLEAAEAAIAGFAENPPEDEPDEPTEPEQPTEPTEPTQPTTPEKPEGGNGSTVIIIIAVVAVVVIAGVVAVLLVLKKKKA